jgi:selenide,water dikinase
VHSNRVPVFPDVLRLIDEKKVPGGTIANCKSYDPYVKWREGITDTERFLLNDAQTSGGLLIFVPGDKKERLVTALQNENILAAYIGDIFSGEIEDSKRIFVD